MEEGSEGKLPNEEDLEKDLFEEAMVKAEFDSDVDMNPFRIPIVFCKNESPLIHNKNDSKEDLETVIKPESDMNDDVSTALIPPKKLDDNTSQLRILCPRIVPFKCNDCAKIFTTLSSLNRHKESHRLTKRLFDENKAKPKPVQMLCDFCTFVAFYKTDFDRHLRKHSSNEPFKCEVCGKSFVSKSSMRKHRGIFTCRSCKKNIPSRHLLEEYETRPDVHKYLRKYHCDLCSYRTHFRKHMIRHLSKHSI